MSCRLKTSGALPFGERLPAMLPAQVFIRPNLGLWLLRWQLSWASFALGCRSTYTKMSARCGSNGSSKVINQRSILLSFIQPLDTNNLFHPAPSHSEGCECGRVRSGVLDLQRWLETCQVFQTTRRTCEHKRWDQFWRNLNNMCSVYLYIAFTDACLPSAFTRCLCTHVSYRIIQDHTGVGSSNRSVRPCLPNHPASSCIHTWDKLFG